MATSYELRASSRRVARISQLVARSSLVNFGFHFWLLHALDIKIFAA
jgi:hypothetical protein